MVTPRKLDVQCKEIIRALADRGHVWRLLHSEPGTCSIRRDGGDTHNPADTVTLTFRKDKAVDARIGRFQTILANRIDTDAVVRMIDHGGPYRDLPFTVRLL
jgi:hypothetical protein